MTKFDFGFLKKKSVMVILGLLSLGLLLISIGTANGKNEVKSTEKSDFNEEEYTLNLESDAAEMINSVSGVKSCRVNVTVECTYEKVYAKDGNDVMKIRNSNGDENGLELTVKMPKVRGVAVVYKGNDSSYVKKEIVSLVSALFDIPSNRIYVGCR